MFARAIADAFLLFAAVFALHVLAWRSLRPRRQIRALALLFGPLGAGGGILALTAWSGRPPAEALHAALLYTLLAGAYILSYPAMQAQAPSLEMVKRIGRAGPRGLTYDELRRSFAHEDLVGCRWEDLLTEGLIRPDGAGGYRISPFAKTVLHTMRLLRAALGLPEGEG